MREKQIPTILSRDTGLKLIALEINITGNGVRTQGPDKALILCPIRTIPILVSG